MRSPQPALTVQMTERVYCMDVAGPLSVVATADRKVAIFNLNNPSTPYKVRGRRDWQPRRAVHESADGRGGCRVPVHGSAHS